MDVLWPFRRILLEYDGVTWRKIFAAGSVVRAIAVDDAGKMMMQARYGSVAEPILAIWKQTPDEAHDHLRQPVSFEEATLGFVNGPPEQAGALAALLAHLAARESEGRALAAEVLHLYREVHFTLANAGHIAPYLSGRELDTPPALPLGLVAGQVYELVYGRLIPGERLVLMSDGVPEARTDTGELYGFERLPELTLMPAQDIADTAQRFGQEDDITVLTLAIAS